MVVLRGSAARPPSPAARDGRRRPRFDIMDSSSEFISLEPPTLSSRRIWTRSGAAAAAARAAGSRGTRRANEAALLRGVSCDKYRQSRSSSEVGSSSSGEPCLGVDSVSFQ